MGGIRSLFNILLWIVCCRYKMLLESLLLKTPQEHPDYQKLQEATEQIRKIASHINENIRQHENFQKMLSIQKGLTGDGAPKILAPGTVICHPNSSSSN